MDEQQRKDLREWGREWRYWLGGVVVFGGVWVFLCIRAGEVRYFWPLAVIGVWGLILLAAPLFPRGKDGSAGKNDGA